MVVGRQRSGSARCFSQTRNRRKYGSPLHSTTPFTVTASRPRAPSHRRRRSMLTTCSAANNIPATPLLASKLVLPRQLTAGLLPPTLDSVNAQPGATTAKSQLHLMPSLASTMITLPGGIPPPAPTPCPFHPAGLAPTWAWQPMQDPAPAPAQVLSCGRNDQRSRRMTSADPFACRANSMTGPRSESC